MNEDFRFSEDIDRQAPSAEKGNAGDLFNPGNCYETGQDARQNWTQAFYGYRKAAKQDHTPAQDKPNACCGESAPKEERGKKEDDGVSPLIVLLQIAMFACLAASPFVDPEMMDLTPVCQLIIACLYGISLVIAVSYEKASKRLRSVMLWLYFFIRAASILFGLLFLGGLPGFAIIFCPFMFWLFILWVGYLQDP